MARRAPRRPRPRGAGRGGPGRDGSAGAMWCVTLGEPGPTIPRRARHLASPPTATSTSPCGACSPASATPWPSRARCSPPRVDRRARRSRELVPGLDRARGAVRRRRRPGGPVRPRRERLRRLPPSGQLPLRRLLPRARLRRPRPPPVGLAGPPHLAAQRPHALGPGRGAAEHLVVGRRDAGVAGAPRRRHRSRRATADDDPQRPRLADVGHRHDRAAGRLPPGLEHPRLRRPGPGAHAVHRERRPGRRLGPGRRGHARRGPRRRRHRRAPDRRRRHQRRRATSRPATPPPTRASPRWSATRVCCGPSRASWAACPTGCGPRGRRAVAAPSTPRWPPAPTTRTPRSPPPRSSSSGRASASVGCSTG